MGGARRRNRKHDAAPAEHRAKLTSALNKLSGALLELSLLQARARLDAITIEPVDLTGPRGVLHRQPLSTRLDERPGFGGGFVAVDSIQCERAARAIWTWCSTATCNQTDNPFSLSGKNGRLRVGVQFDPPLTRIGERNTYRQSLIEYQQAKRAYYQFRDRVTRNLRSTLRK